MIAANVLLAGVVVVGVFTFHPTYHPIAMPAPPRDLPYTHVSYRAADAERAFATVGITLVRQPQTPAAAAPIVDLTSGDAVVEVSAFGDPREVVAAGFSDYITFRDGKWIRTPPSCGHGAANAERWRGNIRVIVSCGRAGGSAARVLGRVSRALAQL